MPSEPEALTDFFRRLGPGVTRIGPEAGPLSQWLHAGLTGAGFEARLPETMGGGTAHREGGAIGDGRHDRNDAAGIAQLLRMGWYRPVHRKSGPAQEIRALLVGRKLLQGKLLDVELSIRGILRGFGLKVGEVSKGRFAARVRELPAGLVAVTFASAVDDPARFSRSRPVGARFGLTPSMSSSKLVHVKDHRRIEDTSVAVLLMPSGRRRAAMATVDQCSIRGLVTA